MSLNFSLIVPLLALALGGIVLGGGIYETLVVDRAWPRKPAIIQPARGGLNRGAFWTVTHPPFELALLASLWLNWAHPAARSWLIAALVTHFGARAWSFAYFIPWALRFEKMGDLTEDQRRQAERWIRLSRVRPFIEFISLIAVGIAVAAEAGTGG